MLVPAATGGSVSLAQQLSSGARSPKRHVLEDGRRRLRPSHRAASSTRSTPASRSNPPRTRSSRRRTRRSRRSGRRFGSRRTCSATARRTARRGTGTSSSRATATRRSRPPSCGRLAHQVVRAGITRVTGRVVGDESWFDARRTAPAGSAKFYLHESPAALGAHRRPWLGRSRRDTAGARCGADLPTGSSSTRASRSAGRRRPASRPQAPRRSATSCRRRSPPSSSSWTRGATTSPPRCS